MLVRDTPNTLIESIEPSTTVTIVGKQNLSDADLDAWLGDYARFARRGDKSIRVLVITDGGTPPSNVRKRMTDAVGDGAKGLRTVILSDAATVRFVTSTLSFFSDNVYAFSPKEIHAAFTALDYSEREKDAALRELNRIARTTAVGRFTAFDAICAHLGAARG